MKTKRLFVILISLLLANSLLASSAFASDNTRMNIADAVLPVLAAEGDDLDVPPQQIEDEQDRQSGADDKEDGNVNEDSSDEQNISNPDGDENQNPDGDENQKSDTDKEEPVLRSTKEIFSYIDEYGTTRTLQPDEYTVIESSDDDLAIGTNEKKTYYVVTGRTDIAGRITIQGYVHLILGDNCKLLCDGICVPQNHSIDIYCQEGKTGSLNASAYGTIGYAGIGGGDGNDGDGHGNGGPDLLQLPCRRSGSKQRGGCGDGGYAERLCCGPRRHAAHRREHPRHHSDAGIGQHAETVSGV